MKRQNLRSLTLRVLQIPYSFWVFIGFFITYLYFFIQPIFLREHVMQFFTYLPAIDPIGEDLRQILSYSKEFVAFHSPYIGKNLYPPLTSILFSPLLLFDFSFAYRIITLFSIFCYFFCTWIFPIIINKSTKNYALLALIGVTGALSYGFQFELERGQFNIIAVFFALLAILVFFRFPKLKFLAYLFFSLAVQLKLYPFIFIFLLIKDWKAWKDNLKIVITLSLINFALFFIMGTNVFVQFVKAIISQSINPQSWIGNHSIRSYFLFINNVSPEIAANEIYNHSTFLQIAFMSLAIACLIIIIIFVAKRNQNKFSKELFFTSTLVALLIPSISHDYTLSILAAPFATYFMDIDAFSAGKKKSVTLVLIIIVFSILYSSTLYSYTNKFLFFGNNFFALMLSLLILVFITVVKTRWIEDPIQNAQ